MLCLGKGLVVILSYALTAEQPDPCGPEPYSPGKWPRTRSPLGEGPVTPRVQKGGSPPPKPLGPRTPPGPGPHILSGPLGGWNRHPAWVRSRHVSTGAGTHAAPLGFLWKTRLPTAFNAVDGSAPCHSRARGVFLPGCTVDRVLPRRVVQSLALSTPRMSVYYASWTRRLGFACYDAYTVDPAAYAASYITPTGALPMGQ